MAVALARSGCDLLVCETFPSADEATVAVEEGARTGLPTWVALTAGPSADLLSPEQMERAARACVSAGASAVLVSCTPAARTDVYVERLARVGAPFGAYANAGGPEDALGWDAASEDAPERYAELARRWISAGATIVGSCCGTGPAHVAAVARALHAEIR
jgi:S-methylmethionine-dependent homocysteine/selenocysteine methylase